MSKNDTYRGYEYVDLGLSVLWAACNMTTQYINDIYGKLFAWGYKRKFGNTMAPFDCVCRGLPYFCKPKRGRYTCDYAFPTWGIDIGDIEGTEYDIAHVEYGGGWRMPTMQEFEELTKECRMTLDIKNSVLGLRLTAKNKNSIFLPYRKYANAGLYWSGTSCPNSKYARAFVFGSDDDNADVFAKVEAAARCCTAHIRPVLDRSYIDRQDYTVFDSIKNDK